MLRDRACSKLIAPTGTFDSGLEVDLLSKPAQYNWEEDREAAEEEEEHWSENNELIHNEINDDTFSKQDEDDEHPALPRCNRRNSEDESEGSATSTKKLKTMLGGKRILGKSRQLILRADKKKASVEEVIYDAIMGWVKIAEKKNKIEEKKVTIEVAKARIQYIKELWDLGMYTDAEIKAMVNNQFGGWI